LNITLSLWDIAGQERFEFFKTDFFRGTAAVGLVFDNTRLDTFKNINKYITDIRKRSGNIPIILVGNKNDLKKTIGEIIPREKIIKRINKDNLIGYLETSAKTKKNIDKLFKKLAVAALSDIHPRLGEIDDDDHFRFKILLLGDAGVGKSSIIKAFFNQKLENNYKLTIGLDLLRKDITIPDNDIPIEINELIKSAMIHSKKKLRPHKRKEKTPIFEEQPG